jgi:type I restriction enzyme S subunit
MKSNYKKLGKYIQQVSIRNNDLTGDVLLGVSIQKILIPSIANIVGTDMSTYKKIKKNQFAYGPVTSRNGDKISIAICEVEKAILSQAYTIFEIIDENELLPEYLMMWFRRAEFDRYARFKSHGSARETFDWDEMCEIKLPVPSLEKQQEIVNEYKTIQNRIKLNENLIQKLEETAQAIYRRWFVEFEFPNEEGLPYKSAGGEMVESEFGEIPKGWNAGTLEQLTTQFFGFSFKGEDYSFDEGITVLRGENVTEKKLRWDTHKKWNSDLDARMKKCFLKERDIVIGMDGSKVGKNWSLISNYDLPLLLAQRVSCLRSKISEFQSFIYYSMCVLDFEYYTSQVQTGTSIPHISGQQIFDFPILIPEENLLYDFDKIVSKIIENNSRKKTEIQSLVELKDLLLVKMTKVESTSLNHKFSTH